MQNNKFTNSSQLLFIWMVMSFVCVGCTKEELAECNPYSHTFTIRVNDADKDSITAAKAVKEITVYVYDEAEQFLALHQAAVDKPIELSYPQHPKLNIVVLGNAASNKQQLPLLNIGDPLHATALSLITTKAAPQAASSPDDLFKGRKTLSKSSAETVHIIDLHRKVGSVVITTKGIQSYVHTTSEAFHYILRYGKRQLNFKGDTTAEDVTHQPTSTFNNGLLESSIFNILPALNSNIEIDIYNGSLLVSTIKKDKEGTPLTVKAGELLNIYANYSEDVEVSVSIETTPWGEKTVWKEF
jgi:hypothetical protein